MTAVMVIILIVGILLFILSAADLLLSGYDSEELRDMGVKRNE
ncbi:MAG: hypothetical protein ACK4VW_07990 [Anaerolineales bacterium]